VAALGLVDSSRGEIRINDALVARQSMFDRVVYLDAGLQAALPNWQLDGGVAVLFCQPLREASFIGVMPTLAIKYVPSVGRAR